MTRNAGDILRVVESFHPVDGDRRALDTLLGELCSAGVPAHALPALFGVFERFPDDDGSGVPWSIVHGIEALDVDYEQPLRDSLARRRSQMGEVMLGRLEWWNASSAGE